MNRITSSNAKRRHPDAGDHDHFDKGKPPVNRNESTMKTQIKLAAICYLLSAIPFTVFAQGVLTPPGAPAPTMKTLAQIEPRTPISSAPFTISAPGSYYLTTNLNVSSGNAITIATNDVTLDLGGWTISSTAASATGAGISINTGNDLTILNGHIKGGVTNNGSGVYSGPGFAGGIVYSGAPQFNTHVSGVSISGCLSFGINLDNGSGNGVLVEYCTVRTVGVYGIYASVVKNSVVVDCGNVAITGDQVSDCQADSDGNGNGISASTALNCNGDSFGGTGLYANTAQNCYGFTISGTGLYANNAQNCFGKSQGTGTGLVAVDTAIGCSGYSYSGTGLVAYTANSCRGTTLFGTAQSITNKYNMP
jgi:hypothetical protein